MTKSHGRLAGWLASVAWLAVDLAGRGMAQTAANNNFVSANLNGAASYTLPTITTIGGAITVEGWVYPRTHALWQRIVDIGGGASSNNVLLAASQGTTGKPIFTVYSGATVVFTITAPDALPLNTWSHVAGVLGSDLSGKLYINGALVASGTATAVVPSVTRSSGFLAKSNWPDALLDGALGEVRIWNVARTQAQIQAAMPAGSITGATTGLLMDYPFGVTGSSALFDISGNNLHLTQTGTVGYSKFLSGTLAASGFRGSSTVDVSGGILSITGSDNDYTGTTTVASGATFRLGNGGATGSPGGGGIANSGTVAFNRSNELIVGNVISGSGSVIQEGSGTTILNAANSYAGTTTVAAGTLEVLARVAASTAPYVVSAGGTLKVGYDTGADYGNPPFTVHGAGVASQAGLQVMGGKTLISNSGILLDTAPSTIRAYGTGSATLRGFDVNSAYFLKNTAAASGSVVDGAVSISTGLYGYKVDTESGANTASGDLLLRGPISGTPGLFKVGAGRLVLSANNTYAGTTTISAGTLQVGEGGTSGALGSGNVVNNGALAWRRSDSLTFPQAVSGTGSVTQSGTGTTILTGANTYSGATTISAGTLQVGAGGTTGTLGPANVSNSGTLAFNRSDAVTVAQVVSGTGGLTQSGSGTTTLTSANTYSGATTISAGTLQVGAGGTSGSLGSGAVVNHATLSLNRSDAVTLANAVSGSGRLVKQGTQTLTVSGAVSSTGGITVQGGTLLFSGSTGLANNAANTVTVENGAIFSINRHDTFGAHDATVVAPIVVNSGGTLRNEAGWFNVLGPVTLRGGTLQATATHSSGYSFPLKGTVTVDGGAATSTLTGPGLALGGAAVTETTFDVLDGSAPDDLVVEGVLQNGPANILLQPMASSSLRKTGAGRMTLTANNTYTGTTTLAAGRLQVGTGGTSGSLGSGNIVNNASLAWNRTDAITVANAISGSGSIEHEGSGTLTLTGANTYSGTTTIGSGTLSVGAGGASGTLGTGDVSVAGTLLFNTSASLTVNGLVSGAGAVRKAGTGTVVLGNVAHSYAGGTTVEAGTLEVLGRAEASTAPYVVAAGGTLRLGYSTSGGYSNPTFTVHGAGVASQAGLQVMGGKTLLSNSGILLDTAPSTIRAYGTGTAFLGGFDINSAYFLKTTAAASGSVVDTAVGVTTGLYGYKVHVDPGANTSTGDLVLRGPITGSQGLIKVGNGRLVVAGANTYAGVTTISAGTLQVGEGGTTGTLGPGHVSNGGVLVVNRSDAITVPGVISGSGSFIKTGSGTVTLTAASTYSGATTLAAGTLAMAGSGSLSGTPGITMANGTTLDVSGRSSILSLASGQSLSVSSGNATLKGSLSVGAGRLGLVPGANGCLAVQDGTLTLSASTSIEVTVPGSALVAGSYKLVSKGTGGAVAGTVPSVTMQGAGIAAGTQAVLAIVSDELVLRVQAPATIALSNLSQRFDGTGKIATATTTPSGLPVVLTYNGGSSAPSAIGSYAVVATVQSSTHHGSTTGTLVIQKGLATVMLGNLLQSYDGTQRRATVTTAPANLNVTLTYDGDSNPPVAVGRYAVVGTVNDARYEGTASGRLVIVSGNAGKGPPANPLPPGFLNYQGYLTDGARQPVGATSPVNVRMVFRLFDTVTGGVPLWAEEQGTVVDRGQFSVVLGEGNPMGMEAWPSLASVFVSNGASRIYLQVTARGLGAGGSDLTVMPRVLLPPVPYAYLSRHSLTASRLLNASSSPVLSVNGQSVGVMQSSPGATLDVAGEVAAAGLRSTGNAQVGGVIRAARISGRGVLPVGGIVAWTGATPPLGWALCDGNIVNGIKTPDLRGRFILGIGQGTGLSPRTLGELGGFENVTLSLAQMPRHSHLADPPPFSTGTDGQHRHQYRGSFGLSATAVMQHNRDDPNHLGRVPTSNPTLPAGEHNHSLDLPLQTSAGVGQGLPHANLPPFYVMAFIMRVQ